MSIVTTDHKKLKIADVQCTEEDLVVSLKDGRKFVTPLPARSRPNPHSNAPPFAVGVRRTPASPRRPGWIRKPGGVGTLTIDGRTLEIADVRCHR